MGTGHSHCDQGRWPTRFLYAGSPGPPVLRYLFLPNLSFSQLRVSSSYPGGSASFLSASTTAPRALCNQRTQSASRRSTWRIIDEQDRGPSFWLPMPARSQDSRLCSSPPSRSLLVLVPKPNPLYLLSGTRLHPRSLVDKVTRILGSFDDRGVFSRKCGVSSVRVRASNCPLVTEISFLP